MVVKWNEIEANKTLKYAINTYTDIIMKNCVTYLRTSTS